MDEALLAQLCVIPDGRMEALNNYGESELAPVAYLPHRPADWKHYRLNLWKSITPKGVGRHARLLVPLFLTFVK